MRWIFFFSFLNPIRQSDAWRTNKIVKYAEPKVIIDFCRFLLLLFKSHWLIIYVYHRLHCSHFCTYFLDSPVPSSSHLCVFRKKTIRLQHGTVKMETTQSHHVCRSNPCSICVCLFFILMPAVKYFKIVRSSAANLYCVRSFCMQVIETSSKNKPRERNKRNHQFSFDAVHYCPFLAERAQRSCCICKVMPQVEY